MDGSRKNIVVEKRGVPIHFFRKIPFKCHHLKTELMVIGYTDGMVVIIDEKGSQYTLQCQNALSGISFACCSAEHKISASATVLDKLYIYEDISSSNEPVNIFSGHEGRALDVAWFSNSLENIVVTSDERGNIYSRKGNILKDHVTTNVYRVHRKAALRVLPFVLKDKPVFLTFSDDRNVLLHNPYTGEIIQDYSFNTGWIDTVVPLGNGQQVDAICICDRVGILFWNILEKKFLGRYPFFVTTNFSLSYPENSVEYMIVGSRNKYLISRRSPEKLEFFTYLNKENIRAISFIHKKKNDNNSPPVLLACNNKIFIHMPLAANSDLQVKEDPIWEFDSPVLTWHDWLSNEQLILLEDGSVHRFSHSS